MATYIYTRVSSKQQAEDNKTSLSSQLDACKGWVGTHIKPISIGETVSGRSINGQKRLQELEESMPDNSTLVVYSIDRLGRNMIDVLQLYERLKSRGIRIKSVSQDYDFYTVDGLHMFRSILSCAQLEVDRLSARIKASVAFRKQRGDVIGRVPFGLEAYRDNLINARRTRVCKKEAEVIRLIRKYRGLRVKSLATGLPKVGKRTSDRLRNKVPKDGGDKEDSTDAGIARNLNKAGYSNRGKPFTPSSIRTIRKRNKIE